MAPSKPEPDLSIRQETSDYFGGPSPCRFAPLPARTPFRPACPLPMPLSSLFKLLFKDSTKRPCSDPAGLAARAALSLF